MSENIAQIVPLDRRQQIASSAIKETLANAGAKVVSGEEVALKTRGRQLKVSIGQQKPSLQPMSVSSVQKMMADNQMSMNQASKVMSAIRKSFGRQSIEKNAIKQIVANSHSEDEFFCIKTFFFQDFVHMNQAIIYLHRQQLQIKAVQRIPTYN